MRRTGLVVALLGLVLWTAPAMAQDTGSSFGGGDFSGGGGGGGGGGSDYGGSSSGYSSSDYGSSSSSGGSGDFSGGALLVMLLMIGGALWIAAVMERRRGGRLRRVASEVSDEIDVSAITLGIDWRARKEIQARLAQLAESGDLKTREGRVQLLRESTVLLRRTEPSWLYADVTNHSLTSRDTAEGNFRRAAADARSRYKKELVRGDEAGVRRAEAGEQTARRVEGAGVVIVTLVVAAHREIVDLDNPADARSLRGLLSVMSSLVAHQLAALEVIWSPAAENDRMSSAELETLYPELKKIDETSVAGRVFCTYCGGPFAAELMKCPHCAAPLERRAASS